MLWCVSGQQISDDMPDVVRVTLIILLSDSNTIALVSTTQPGAGDGAGDDDSATAVGTDDEDEPFLK